MKTEYIVKKDGKPILAISNKKNYVDVIKNSLLHLLVTENFDKIEIIRNEIQ